MTDDNMRIDTMVLGRKIGTHAGYETVDDFIEVFVDFEPTDDIEAHLPACELVVDYACGLFLEYDDKGDIIWDNDIISVLWFIEPETK
jgi:hypothetical protein